MNELTNTLTIQAEAIQVKPNKLQIKKKHPKTCKRSKKKWRLLVKALFRTPANINLLTTTTTKTTIK